MKKIFTGYIVAIVMACSPQSTNSTQEPSHSERLTSTVWMRLIGDWQYSPPDEHVAPFRSSLATVIRFAEDHQFSMIECWVVESQGGHLTISNGDGQAIFIGSWQINKQKEIDILFRLVYEMIPPVEGGEYPGPEEKATAMPTGETIQFQGKTFTQAKGLAFAEYERFVDNNGSRLKVDG